MISINTYIIIVYVACRRNTTDICKTLMDIRDIEYLLYIYI